MTDDWGFDSEFDCPICGDEQCVIPRGSKSSPILLIGDAPGQQEIKKGRAYVGATGALLKKELAYLKVDLNRIRITNLWHHAPNKNEDCFKHGVNLCLKEAKGKKLILLMGAKTVEYFCNKSVMSVNGLRVTSPYLSAPIIMACLQPAIVFKGGGVGEVRLALKKFSIEANKLL